MNNANPASIYQQTSAHSGSAVGIIVSLYDIVLRDLRRALAAMKAGNIETRVMELNHALTVVAHLESVLDHEKGLDAAAQFKRFYRSTRVLALNANVRGSAATVEELIELYTGVRAAWQQAEQNLIETNGTSLQMSAAINRPGPVTTPRASGDSPSGPRTNWSA